jgi:hypothetical protein
VAPAAVGERSLLARVCVYIRWAWSTKLHKER